MAYENIRSTQPHVAVSDNYYYVMYPSPLNFMAKRTDAGDVVMTYPFNYSLSPIDNLFYDLQYDGINFWSLEKHPSYSTSRRLIRRWRLENLCLVLKDSWELRGQGSPVENMNGNAFAVEHYKDKLSAPVGPDVSGWESKLRLTTPTACYFQPGDNVTLKSVSTTVLNDNFVSSVIDPYTIQMGNTWSSDFLAGDQVVHYRGLYYFNNEAPSVGATNAAVYNFTVNQTTGDNPTLIRTPNYQTCTINGMYSNTLASTFATVSGISAINNGYKTGLIMYVRGPQLLFKKPNLPNSTVPYPDGTPGTNTEFRNNVASMFCDTLINAAKTGINSVYQLTNSDDTDFNAVNIYRLQNTYTYDSDGNWGGGNYNYVVSVLQPMVTSVTLVASPAILPVGSATQQIAYIWAVVRDQYDNPLNNKRVSFQVANHCNGMFVHPDNITGPSDPQGCFALTGTYPYRTAEIMTGCQTNVAPGTVVVGWQVGNQAGYPTFTATVTQ